MNKRIGEGRLTWPRGERISDRYGTVMLMLEGDEFATIAEEFDDAEGQLVAEVLEARESDHIGDLFRGLFPHTPEVGERIVLGEGKVFVERDPLDGVRVDRIGIKPADGRASDWLDPVALYRAHDQTVRLVLTGGGE